jgi:hypothetical protein
LISTIKEEKKGRTWSGGGKKEKSKAKKVEIKNKKK